MRARILAGKGTAVLIAIAVAPVISQAQEDPGAVLTDLLKRVELSELGYAETADAFRPEFEKFIRDNPGTEEALTAKFWLLQQTWWEKDTARKNELAGKYAEEILAEYPDSPQLNLLAEYDYNFSDEQRERFMGELISSSPHATVRGSAIYSLAEMGRSGNASTELMERRQVLLKRLQNEYTDVPWHFSTFGEIAEAALNPHDPENLKVGKPAPEIVGRTFDGKPLRLSDFHGKVVVLDFWGDW